MACKLDLIMTPDCKADLHANPKQLQKYMSFHTEFRSAEEWAKQIEGLLGDKYELQIQ